MAPRIYTDVVTIGSISIYQVIADPNGSLNATIGSLATRSDVAAVYVNTDGANAWSQLGSGGGGSSIPLGIQHASINATNTGDSFNALQADGIINDFARGSSSETREHDAGGSGSNMESSGSGAGSTYINGGISDATDSGIFVTTEARPFYEHRFKINTVANGRFFCGFTEFAESTPLSSASDDPASAYFGLQFSPDTRGDTNFQIAGKSASGGTQVLVDTGVTPAPGTIYRLVIDGNNSGSWTATLWNDGDGTPNFTSSVLFTTTVVDANAIPAVGTGYAFAISFSETVATLVSFTHYFVNLWLRAGAQIS